MALIRSGKAFGGSYSKTAINLSTADSPQTFNVNNGVLVMQYSGGTICQVAFSNGAAETPDINTDNVWGDRFSYANGVLTLTTPNRSYQGWLYSFD